MGGFAVRFMRPDQNRPEVLTSHAPFPPFRSGREWIYIPSQCTVDRMNVQAAP